MKNLIVSFLFFFPLQIVNGQDKIITIQHDTIRCRIISISPSHIQYEQIVDGFTIGKFISTEQVLSHLQNTQPEQVNPYDRFEKLASKSTHRCLASVQTGSSFLTAPIIDETFSGILNSNKTETLRFSYNQNNFSENLSGKIIVVSNDKKNPVLEIPIVLTMKKMFVETGRAPSDTRYSLF